MWKIHVEFNCSRTHFCTENCANRNKHNSDISIVWHYYNWLIILSNKIVSYKLLITHLASWGWLVCLSWHSLIFASRSDIFVRTHSTVKLSIVNWLAKSLPLVSSTSVLSKLNLTCSVGNDLKYTNKILQHKYTNSILFESYYLDNINIHLDNISNYSLSPSSL